MDVDENWKWNKHTYKQGERSLLLARSQIEASMMKDHLNEMNDKSIVYISSSLCLRCTCVYVGCQLRKCCQLRQWTMARQYTRGGAEQKAPQIAKSAFSKAFIATYKNHALQIIKTHKRKKVCQMNESNQQWRRWWWQSKMMEPSNSIDYTHNWQLTSLWSI